MKFKEINNVLNLDLNPPYFFTLENVFGDINKARKNKQKKEPHSQELGIPEQLHRKSSQKTCKKCGKSAKKKNCAKQNQDDKNQPNLEFGLICGSKREKGERNEHISWYCCNLCYRLTFDRDYFCLDCFPTKRLIEFVVNTCGGQCLVKKIYGL